MTVLKHRVFNLILEFNISVFEDAVIQLVEMPVSRENCAKHSYKSKMQYVRRDLDVQKVLIFFHINLSYLELYLLIQNVSKGTVFLWWFVVA